MPELPKPLGQFKIYSDRVDLEFTDGRVARLMIGVRVFKPQLKTQLQVVENICAPEIIGEGCEWTFDYIDARIAFVWAINPDANRINKILIIKTAYQYDPDVPPNTSEKILEGTTSNLTQPFYFRNQSSPVLSCKDDRWVQQMYQKSLQKFIVPSWSSEFMQPNQITGKNENIGLFQLNNTELIALGNKRYQLNIVDKSATIFSKITPLQETQTMYFLQGSQQCSVQLKNSLDEIRQATPEDPNEFIEEYPATLPAQIPRGLLIESVFQLADILEMPQTTKTVVVE